jgi:hypothetical protein
MEAEPPKAAQRKQTCYVQLGTAIYGGWIIRFLYFPKRFLQLIPIFLKPLKFHRCLILVQ